MCALLTAAQPMAAELIKLCLLAFRLWPARDCAQGRGLRCRFGP
jgi:hypothetical protein